MTAPVPTKKRRRRRRRRRATQMVGNAPKQAVVDDAFAKDWATPCEVCGQLPTVAETGLCGPCTWGEAETAGGNW